MPCTALHLLLCCAVCRLFDSRRLSPRHPAASSAALCNPWQQGHLVARRLCPPTPLAPAGTPHLPLDAITPQRSTDLHLSSTHPSSAWSPGPTSHLHLLRTMAANLTTFVARVADSMLLVASMDSGTEGSGQQRRPTPTAAPPLPVQLSRVHNGAVVCGVCRVQGRSQENPEDPQARLSLQVLHQRRPVPLPVLPHHSQHSATNSTTTAAPPLPTHPAHSLSPSQLHH